MITDIELDNFVEYATGVNVYEEGQKTAYAVGSGKFEEIKAEWTSMLDGAHRMPAFGVSLHSETTAAMMKGVWLEFEFGRTMTSDGMPYEKLLIAVRPEWTGFNLVRYTAGSGYDGRCFYYDLVDKNMSELYKAMTGE